jgi:TFIIF-interacting CTD phosphatase-like protein
MCTQLQFSGNKSKYIKYLSLLGRDLSKAINVDDNPHSFLFHPLNGMHINPWTGDVNDGWFYHLLFFFNKMENDPDWIIILFFIYLNAFPAEKKWRNQLATSI